MRIAIEGCSHGCLDQIYSSIRALDRKVGKRTSLLILCGDVQTVRNQRDLHCIAVPDKYKSMGDFHRYYNGQRRAPILTLMIGGNHEASNYLTELYHGGWVAPNIYFLGAAGCVNVGGLRIAGISGIYKSHDYTLGRFEQLPYNHSTVRSVYHTRKFDTYRLGLTRGEKLDIVVSHDWPNTIEQYGDVTWLKKRKPFFVDEINTSSLGSPPLWKLLQELSPTYWFSAHLHVRFAALVKHSGDATRVNASQVAEASSEPILNGNGAAKVERVTMESKEAIEMDDLSDDGADTEAGNTNPEAIDIDDDEFDEEPKQEERFSHVNCSDRPAVVLANLNTTSEPTSTRFLALSKCLQGQDFLQILDVPAPFDTQEEYRVVDRSKDLPAGEDSSEQPSFRFDESWLAITRATHKYLSLEKRQCEWPSEKEMQARIVDERRWIEERVKSLRENPDTASHPLDVERTQQFVQTAPPSTDPQANGGGPPPYYTNPQTVALCSMLALENKINPPPPAMLPVSEPSMPFTSVAAPYSEEEEIRRIEEAAQSAMKRQKLQQDHDESEPVTLLDDEDEQAARWKEGTG